MYLLDTNIFLEALLDQEKTEVVHNFLKSTTLDKIFITDLALHSIGIILFNLKKHELFNIFVDDMVKNGMNIISLSTSELTDLSEIASNFNLDFDDSYQYLAAKIKDFQLISFDKDFDKTDINRNEPQEIVQ